MYGKLRKQPQSESLWNEMTNLGSSWGNFVGAMTRLLGGGQRNDGYFPPEAKILLYKTPRPVCGPIGFLLDLIGALHLGLKRPRS